MGPAADNANLSVTGSYNQGCKRGRIERTVDMQITTETITPKKAKSWLENNNRNRNVSRTAVESYAQDMSNGSWLLTGESIKFNGDGTLLDGQHRLLACIEAGESFKSLVVRGLSTESQEAVDSGIKRSFYHVLTIRGVPNASTCAAITRGLYQIKKNTLFKRRLSSLELMPTFEKHHKKIKLAAAHCHNVRVRGLPGSLVATIYTIGKDFLGEEETAERFINSLATGESSYAGDPVIMLREAVLVAKERAVTVRQSALFWTSVWAWNCYVEGLPLERIEWIEEPVRFAGLNYKRL